MALAERADATGDCSYLAAALRHAKIAAQRAIESRVGELSESVLISSAAAIAAELGDRVQARAIAHDLKRIRRAAVRRAAA